MTRRPVYGGCHTVAGLKTMPLLTALLNLQELWFDARVHSQTHLNWLMAGECVCNQLRGQLTEILPKIV